MKVGIIGIGIVGGTLAKILKPYHQLELYDKYKKKYSKNPTHRFSNCEVIFVCVNTPMKISGEIDLSAVYDSMERIISIQHISSRSYKVIVIKSTAVSGTTEKLDKVFGQHNLDLVFNPEFLTARNPYKDFKNTDRIILGTDSEKAFRTIKKVYEQAKFKCPIIKTDFRTAEMVKYVSNTFLATKVMFANEIYSICEKLKIDYNKVIKLLFYDKRINKSHWAVPGPDKNRGFGGTCFPKDLNALIHLAKEKGYDAHLLEEVWRSNLQIRKKKDW